MIPEDLGPYAISRHNVHLLDPAHRVEVTPHGRSVTVTIESRRHDGVMSGTELTVRMPIKTALQLYGMLGAAIDQAISGAVGCATSDAVREVSAGARPA